MWTYSQYAIIHQEAIIMNPAKIDEILVLIAAQERISVEEVRNEMLQAMKEGQQSTDPAVQARWAAIPKKGDELTPEELIAYCVMHK